MFVDYNDLNTFGDNGERLMPPQGFDNRVHNHSISSDSDEEITQERGPVSDMDQRIPYNDDGLGELSVRDRIANGEVPLDILER